MKADKDSVTRLLKTARGQLDGIIRMVEDDRYCIDISNQLMATESVLKKANREVLHGHMMYCVREAFEAGNEETQKEKINEILALIDKLAN